MTSGRKLLKLGAGICVLGILILIYGWFDMYSLAGDCPSGAGNCQAYARWHSINWVGVICVLVGLLVLAFSWLASRRKT
ncbi:MAG TPA: hypothetical protein VFP35_01030 [Candidatus Saccharimonadales bacterium]|nr:hypothetical protein [Candidatus Saccharimonadales bacterium]